jgi:hypothetical protein
VEARHHQAVLVRRDHRLGAVTKTQLREHPAHVRLDRLVGQGQRAGDLCSILYLALVANLSVGVTVEVRGSAAAVGLVLGLLYLFPVLVHVVSDTRWQRHIEQIAPSTAGLNVQATIHLDQLATGPWAGLGVLALWACAVLAAAYVVLVPCATPEAVDHGTRPANPS